MPPSYSKNHRLNIVLETVTAMGTGSPADICARVAQRLMVDGQDVAFLRSIYRDLKQLANEGRLNAEIFAPDGARLDPEDADTAKNIRIEYHLPHVSGSQIPGWKTLHDYGGRLIPPSRAMSWKISSSVQHKAAGHFSLLFRAHGDSWAVLQLFEADFPAKILFCRESPIDPLPADFASWVAEVHGLRTLVFACPDKSMSRAGKDGRLGHALLSIDATGQMALQDLGSKAGSLHAPCTPELLNEAISAKFNESTVPLNLNPFETKAEWTEAATAGSKISHAELIQLGSLRFAALIKPKAV